MKKNVQAARSHERTGQIILESPKNGDTVQILNDDVYAFTVGYAEGRSEAYAHKGDNYAPKSIVLTWRSNVNVDEFQVSISHTKDFLSEETYWVKGTSLELVAPFRQKGFFWKVQAFSNGVRYVSETYSFVLDQLPKCFFIEGVSNTREVFGYVGSNEKRIGRNRLFRGGNADSITESGKKFVAEKLKIRTDLDLRKDGEGTAGERFSPLGEGIKHVHSSGSMYLGKEGLDIPEGRQRLIDGLQVFAEEENFPVYVHCVLGRDRTGTLIAVLLALCGVSKEDITYDYELSFFSEIACSQGTDVAKLMGSVNNTLGYLYSFDGDTLQEKMVNFLLQTGMSREQLCKIQANLLTETV